MKIDQYKYTKEIISLKKERFCEIFSLTYPQYDVEQWWSEFEKLSDDAKISFFLEDMFLLRHFEIYKIGFDAGKKSNSGF